MSVLHIFLFLFLIYHHVLLASGIPKTIVLTKLGFVSGIQEDVQLHNEKPHTVYKFLGVPYAQKPIDKLRFKRPLSLWNPSIKIYNATYYRPVCLQFSNQFNTYIGSMKLAWPGFDPSTDMNEDCLYLNIYTPSTNCRKRKYPVMVHIHGGSYMAGTPIRDTSPGEYLPRHDVVLVTFQYRLGAFGFFTTGDSEAPGNLGLLDQVEALKWIQNNIDGFCGNKNSVTLFGESAGGSSVSLHYLSPLSKDLFHRGIAVSGVALAPFAFKPNTTVLKASKTLIKDLGCDKQNSQLTVKCMQDKGDHDIIAANMKYVTKVQPFVDNYFLQDEPRKLLKEGTFHGQKLPLISGFVTNEGTNGILEPNIANIPADYKNYLDTQLLQGRLGYTKQEAPTAFNALVHRYTPWAESKRSEAYKKNVIDMLSDYMVIAPTHAALSFHSDHGANTYMFEFAHRSRNNTGPVWKGVTHEDTTAYKFGLPLLKSSKTDLTFEDDDRSVSKKMVTLFTNFAKSGNPNTPIIVKGVQWTAFDTSNKAYLKIKKSPAMTSNYHPIRMAFWNSYFPKLFPCKRQSWYGRCKKSEAPKPLQSPNGVESNPATLVRGPPNT